MIKRPHPQRSFALALASLCAGSWLFASAFETPHWAGGPDASHSEWLDFTVAHGDPGNAPDVEGTTGSAVLSQWTPGAIVTGSKNIYHPGARAYLQHGLHLGRLVFAVASLHGGGHGVRTFPGYYTRDSLIGDAPKLELTARLQDAPEVLTLVAAPGPHPGTLRFPAAEGASYGIRWSADLKSWHLIRDPALTTPEPGVAEWVDDAAPDQKRFYQVYRQP